jgi:AcrR family transcriptional regulator
MSPRAYQLGLRQASVDDTRRRVLTAARELLTEPSGYAVFTVDAIARRADVARATVYYRFGSKAGLLEALFDDLAARGHLEQLAEAFTEPDPDRALRRFVACFGEFWASDRLVLRRVRALAALDPDVGPLIAARDERRRDGLRELLSRRAGAAPRQAETVADLDELEARVAIAHTLTSFETFDTLAGPGQDPRDLVPVVADLVLHAITALRG